MNGYQITFLIHPDSRHNDKPLAQWLVDLARDMDLCGASLSCGGQHFGHPSWPQGANFPSRADQTLAVLVTATAERSAQLFDRLTAENVNLFYVKAPIEFGMLGTSPV